MIAEEQQQLCELVGNHICFFPALQGLAVFVAGEQTYPNRILKRESHFVDGSQTWPYLQLIFQLLTKCKGMLYFRVNFCTLELSNTQPVILVGKNSLHSVGLSLVQLGIGCYGDGGAMVHLVLVAIVTVVQWYMPW